MQPSRLRSEFNARVFVAAMRREWTKRNPGAPCPIADFDTYPADARSALMLALDRTVTTTDQAFESWCEKRQNNPTATQSL